MPLITLAYCRRFMPGKKSSTKCNAEVKTSATSNCLDTAIPQDAHCPCIKNPNSSKIAVTPCEENEVTSEKERLRRSSKRTSSRARTGKTRNAYVNFMDEYRRGHKNLLPWQVMSQAASCWKRLSADEKTKYKTDAQNVKYSYKSKNKALNKVLRTLKSSVAPKEINVSQLTKASLQIKLWKDEVLNSIDCMEEWGNY